MFNFKRSLSIKILVSLICVAILFGSFAVSPIASAFNYPKITLNKTVKGNLEDYFGGVFYELNLNSKKELKIIYSSSTESDLCLYDNKLNTIFKITETKKVDKSISLGKGTYVFGIYNCTYNEGTYSLLVNDNTNYAKKIEFSQNTYTLSYGSSVKTTLIKSPLDSSLKSITYSSSNKAVATVDKNGKIKAKGLGTATIKAKMSKKVKAECTVIVNRRNIEVFSKTSKSSAKINGQYVTFVSSDTSVVKTTAKKIKGISQGTAEITKYIGSQKYTVNVQVVSRAKLTKAGRKKLKNSLSNPNSLVVFHTYRGYDKSGNACVVMDYGVKTSNKITGRKYFICNYSSNFTLNYSYSKTMPNLKDLKEV